MLADKKIPIRGARKMIADKMLGSLQNSAQLTHFAECGADRLLEKKIVARA